MQTPNLQRWHKIALTGGSAIAIMTAIGPYFEGAPHHGDRYEAYYDAIGHKWTICFGETLDVHPGDVKTLAECNEMYAARSRYFLAGAQHALKQPQPPLRLGALGDYCYNRGLPRCQHSTVFALINAGKIQQGCDALLVSDRAQQIQGLYNRRYVERFFCLYELPGARIW